MRVLLALAFLMLISMCSAGYKKFRHTTCGYSGCKHPYLAKTKDMNGITRMGTAKCSRACNEDPTCGGFLWYDNKCAFRRDVMCGQSRNSGRDCYKKVPIKDQGIPECLEITGTVEASERVMCRCGGSFELKNICKDGEFCWNGACHDTPYMCPRSNHTPQEKLCKCDEGDADNVGPEMFCTLDGTSGNGAIMCAQDPKNEIKVSCACNEAGYGCEPGQFCYDYKCHDNAKPLPKCGPYQCIGGKKKGDADSITCTENGCDDLMCCKDIAEGTVYIPNVGNRCPKKDVRVNKEGCEKAQVAAGGHWYPTGPIDHVQDGCVLIFHNGLLFFAYNDMEEAKTTPSPKAAPVCKMGKGEPKFNYKEKKDSECGEGAGMGGKCGANKCKLGKMSAKGPEECGEKCDTDPTCDGFVHSGGLCIFHSDTRCGIRSMKNVECFQRPGKREFPEPPSCKSHKCPVGAKLKPDSDDIKCDELGCGDDTCCIIPADVIYAGAPNTKCPRIESLRTSECRDFANSNGYNLDSKTYRDAQTPPDCSLHGGNLVVRNMDRSGDMNELSRPVCRKKEVKKTCGNYQCIASKKALGVKDTLCPESGCDDALCCDIKGGKLYVGAANTVCDEGCTPEGPECSTFADSVSSLSMEWSNGPEGNGPGGCVVKGGAVYENMYFAPGDSGKPSPDWRPICFKKPECGDRPCSSGTLKPNADMVVCSPHGCGDDECCDLSPGDTYLRKPGTDPSCPKKEGLTKSECQAFSNKHGHTWGEESNASYFPAGCYFAEKRVNFNAHATGMQSQFAQGICKIEEEVKESENYKLNPPGLDFCENEKTQPVRGAGPCMDATKEFGFDTGESGDFAGGDKICYVGKDGRTKQDGKLGQHDRMICEIKKEPEFTYKQMKDTTCGFGAGMGGKCEENKCTLSSHNGSPADCEKQCDADDLCDGFLYDLGACVFRSDTRCGIRSSGGLECYQRPARPDPCDDDNNPCDPSTQTCKTEGGEAKCECKEGYFYKALACHKKCEIECPTGFWKYGSCSDNMCFNGQDFCYTQTPYGNNYKAASYCFKEKKTETENYKLAPEGLDFCEDADTQAVRGAGPCMDATSEFGFETGNSGDFAGGDKMCYVGKDGRTKQDGQLGPEDRLICQKIEAHPCSIDNGGCAQVCVEDGDLAKCECEEGYVMRDEMCFKKCEIECPEYFWREGPCEDNMCNSEEGYCYTQKPYPERFGKVIGCFGPPKCDSHFCVAGGLVPDAGTISCSENGCGDDLCCDIPDGATYVGAPGTECPDNEHLTDDECKAFGEKHTKYNYENVEYNSKSFPQYCSSLHGTLAFNNGAGKANFVHAPICKKTPANPCLMGNGGCHVDAICNNNEGEADCICKEGYRGDGKAICSPIPPCETNHGGCDENAHCENDHGVAKCTCLDGFEGDGKTCEEMDPCKKGMHGCEHACERTGKKGHVCTCPDRKHLKPDNLSCAWNEPCLNDNGGCSKHATCKNKEGFAQCTCTEQYEGDGIVCKKINPCDTNNGGCDANAECSNDDGTAMCQCKTPEYRGNGLKCWRDLCATENGGCHEKSQCQYNAMKDLVHCTCPEGMKGDGRTCEKKNKCDDGNGGCQHKCTPIGDDERECSCNDGYQLRNDGYMCTEICPISCPAGYWKYGECEDSACSNGESMCYTMEPYNKSFFKGTPESCFGPKLPECGRSNVRSHDDDCDCNGIHCNGGEYCYEDGTCHKFKFMCTPDHNSPVGKECMCGTVESCEANEFCYDTKCHAHEKGPEASDDTETEDGSKCTEHSFQAIENPCYCGAATVLCGKGQFCYGGICQDQCSKREDSDKNIFYGLKVYGEWNADSKTVTMKFDTPWEIEVDEIKWKDAASDSLKFTKVDMGFWTVDKATDVCTTTYILTVDQSVFFGDGSKFEIKGSQLNSAIEVLATEKIEQEGNGHNYEYDRTSTAILPVLVNLINKMTVNVNFKIAATQFGEFVFFTGVHQNFDDNAHEVSMEVHSNTCIDHLLADKGVRIISGGENVETSSMTAFTWKRDGMGNVMKTKKFGLCVEELTWSFTPKEYRETTYEIELEFTQQHLGEKGKFTALAEIEIKDADVLADVGFASTVKLYNEEACIEEKITFILGEQLYAKIELTDVILDAESIECEDFKIHQTKEDRTTTTDMKGEEKYQFMEKEGGLNTHICGCKLDNHHFHIAHDGYDSVLEVGILVRYSQGGARRLLFNIPIYHSSERALGNGAHYDSSDKKMRSIIRAPDSDTTYHSFEIMAAEDVEVGSGWDLTDNWSFLNVLFLIIVVFGSFGFGYTRATNKQKVPKGTNYTLIEMET